MLSKNSGQSLWPMEPSLYTNFNPRNISLEPISDNFSKLQNSRLNNQRLIQGAQRPACRPCNRYALVVVFRNAKCYSSTMPALNQSEVQALPWIEEWYLSRGTFPPENEIKKAVPIFEYQYSLSNEIFLKCLHGRGITLPNANNELSNEQMAAIMVVANFRDQRSIAAKLRSVGVTWAKWQGWMRNAKFKEFLQSLCGTNFEDSLDVAQAGLLKAVDKGNVEATKFYLELTGRYTPQSQEVVNIKLILARILEAVQIHVKDPATLRNISTDFERILQGGEPQEQRYIEANL